MRLADPVAAPWKAELLLGFTARNGKTILSEKRADGPLVVQKALYPEGEAVCHAIVVHPPAGIAGGDQILLAAEVAGHALLTTPGAAKWYRSAGPWASQRLEFKVAGTLEWLPRETIVFDGALAGVDLHVELGAQARFIGWEVLCLGRTGSGERFDKGEVRIDTAVTREGRPLLVERGRIGAGGRLARSAAGLGGRTVFGTLLAAADVDDTMLRESRRVEPLAVTLLPGLLVARYLGDSSQEAMAGFTALWKILRPRVLGREAVEPRIWRT